MNPERWQKVSGALDQLLELAPPEQIQFLDKLRAEDPDLCQEVESLAAQPTVALHLEAPPTELLAQLKPAAATSSAIEPPKQLGAYRVVSTLGVGGMGVVYEAEDPTLERRVALKVIKQEFAVQPDARARFLREARAVAALQHDHVLPIYHVGEEGSVVFLVMPLLQGETLEDRLRRTPESPLSQILRIGREVAEGLTAAHARGLIHRDIKPANLWLEAGKDRVKIMDFGLARPAGGDANLTQSGMVLGTPAYMAPEQGRGEDVDGRADLFSLGCVLYRMCTGQTPFQKKDAVSTLLAAASEPAIPPNQKNQAIPESVSQLILKLLAKSPDDRPQSAQEVVDRLAVLERAVPDPTATISLPGVAAAPRTSKSRFSVRRKAMATAFVILLGLVAAYVRFHSTTNSAPGGTLASKNLAAPNENAITPRIAETGKLIFKDDFDTETPKPIFAANLFNFENIGGVGQFTTPTSGVLNALYPEYAVKNFVAECEFELVSEQPDKACGFYFRGRPKPIGTSANYQLLVHPKERKVTFVCWQNPTYTVWNEYPCDERVVFSRSNRVRLEALGTEFRVFINGVFVCRVEDSKITGDGEIGLCGFSAVKGDYTVNFKNLRVFQLDAPYVEPVVKAKDEATPQPAPTGELAFKDDFDTPTALASAPYLPNVISYANERGHGHLTKKTIGVAGVTYANHSLKDFISEVEIESNSVGPDIGYGLFFRSRWGVGQGRPSYRVVAVYPKEQKVWLGCNQEASWMYWTDHPLKPDQIYTDRPNLLRLEAKDDRFRVFINGSFVWQLVDARSKDGGLIGLCANAPPGTGINFSKLRVYRYPKDGKSD